jgi:hypothetical protein
MLYSPFVGLSRDSHVPRSAGLQQPSRSSDLQRPVLSSNSLPPRCDVSIICRCWQDEGRSVISLSLAPDGRLLASVDNLGRVMVLEGRSLNVIRMWKVRIPNKLDGTYRDM